MKNMNFEDMIIGRASTVRSQRSLYLNHIKPYKSLPAKDLARVIYDSDLSPSTIIQALSVLRKYLVWRDGHSPDLGEWRKAASRKVQPKQVTAWTSAEAKKALDMAFHLDYDLYVMLTLTLHTGMRKGEMFGLRWKDVDLLNGRINITKSYDGPTKNGRPRSVPVTNLVDNLMGERYIVGQEQDLCFRRTDPNPRLERLCRAAEITILSWHGLRHTFATLALEAGRSPREVAAQLGHTNVSTTLNTYWSLSNKDIDLSFLP